MITILVVLIIVGVILYLVNQVIPMPDWVRIVINVIAALFVILWLLQVVGVDTGIHLRLRG